MASNHVRPLSNLDFSKPTPTGPKRCGTRKKNVDRMSKNQIEAVIARNEILEAENKALKAEVDNLG